MDRVLFSTKAKYFNVGVVQPIFFKNVPKLNSLTQGVIDSKQRLINEIEIFSETTSSGAHVHSGTAMQITEDAICTKFTVIVQTSDL